jgi:hypothetical protein
MENDELFYIDIKNIRSERQKLNDNKVFELLINQTPLNEITKHINIKALNRFLIDEHLSYEQLLIECKNHQLFAKTISKLISINSSRQGKIDEKLIINEISKKLKKYNVEIKPCDVNEIRFTDDGRILNNQEFKNENIDKTINSLKSIDGIITGKINGYIFAKVVIGSGGHQDNVFKESLLFINWVNNHGNNNDLFILLIDGEDLTKLKQFEKENLWVVNHVDFQKRLFNL